MSTTRKNVSEISSVTEDTIKNRSTFSAPDNPSDLGYTPEQNKALFWKYALDGSNSIMGVIKRVITEINALSTDLYDKIDTKIGGTLENPLYTNISTIEGTLVKLKEVLDTMQTKNLSSVLYTNKTTVESTLLYIKSLISALTTDLASLGQALTNLKGSGYNINQSYSTIKSINDILVLYGSFFSNLGSINSNYNTLQKIVSKLIAMQETINNLSSASEQEAQHLKFNNVSCSNWVSDTTYANYGYKCEITCSGVKASDVVIVTYGLTEATSGNYAPICESYANKVVIYSKVNTSITIPTILVEVI